MDTGIIFLLGVYLVPLALVSAVGAWPMGASPMSRLGWGLWVSGWQCWRQFCARMADTDCATSRN